MKIRDKAREYLPMPLLDPRVSGRENSLFLLGTMGGLRTRTTVMGLDEVALIYQRVNRTRTNDLLGPVVNSARTTLSEQ